MPGHSVIVEKKTVVGRFWLLGELSTGGTIYMGDGKRRVVHMECQGGDYLRGGGGLSMICH